MLLFSKLKKLIFGYSDPVKNSFKILKVINVRSDLGDILAKTATLTQIPLKLSVHK